MGFQSKSDEDRYQDEEGRWILADGDWGTTWLRENGVIRATNPLMFTCKFCGRTSSAYEALAHYHGCEHPGISYEERLLMEKEHRRTGKKAA